MPDFTSGSAASTALRVKRVVFGSEGSAFSGDGGWADDDEVAGPLLLEQ